MVRISFLKFRQVWVAVGLCLTMSTSVLLQAAPSKEPLKPAEPKIWKVALHESPPFAFKNKDGRWDGVAVALWIDIARDLGIAYKFEEMNAFAMAEGIRKGQIQAGIGYVAPRDDMGGGLDYSHPYWVTGLAIAVLAKTDKHYWLQILQDFFSFDFLKVLTLLIASMFLAGVLVWYFERNRNEQFGGHPLHGIGASIWWSVVTMCAVGYGDKVPVTTRGRFIGILWMLSGLVIVSIFTATIVSSFTAGRMESKIHGPWDLHRFRVATVAGSSAQSYLNDSHIFCTSYGSPTQAIEALLNGKMDALVLHRPELRFLVHRQFFGKVEILPYQFHREDYSIVLSPNNPYRSKINLQIFEHLNAPDWHDADFQYLGLSPN